MRRLAAVLLVLLTISAPVKASRIRGYVKSFALTYSLPDTLSPDISNLPRGLVTNRLRLTFTTPLSAKVNLEAAWDLTPAYSEVPLEGIFPTAMGGESGMDYRVADFNRRLVPPSNDPGAGFILNHNLDRLLVTVKFKGADLFIGRQAVAWGSARTINPTDIIAPFAFNELDTEDRRGVDALRLRIPLGMMDELDMGWVMGSDFSAEKSAFFLRGKFYVLRTDAALILSAFRNHLLAGINLARAIGGAGAWVEAAWVKPYAFVSPKPADDTPYFRLSTGLDYSFGGNIYLFTEYHFNSAGRSEPADYLEMQESAAVRDGAVYLMGRHYLSAGTTIQIKPLLPLSLILIWNLSDGSLTLAPSAEYNVAQNVYLAAGAYIGSGEKPRMSSMGPTLRSEFGTWPHMFYTSFRFYF